MCVCVCVDARETDRQSGRVGGSVANNDDNVCVIGRYCCEEKKKHIWCVILIRVPAYCKVML